jgi:hypothetical protein
MNNAQQHTLSMNPRLEIALLPLDERPANTRYPAHVAAIAGASLRLPPSSALPDLRTPADRDALVTWLGVAASQCDGVVASADLLLHGGLIASRVHDEAPAQVLPRLGALLALNSAARPVFVFNVIQRTSNANDATEEAPYWADYCVALYEYSRVLDAALDARTSAEQHVPAGGIPTGVRHTWLKRRLRNHVVNQAMLHSADNLSLLVIPSDDTSPYGMAARERKHLEAYAAALAHSGQGGAVLMYPGADDLGSALVARMINHKRGHHPGVFVHYFDDTMRRNVAPYEDRPIEMAVDTQIMAVGARRVHAIDQADVVLAVNPPFERSPVTGDPRPGDLDTAERRAALRPAVDQVRRWVEEGRSVAIADLAVPNGAEIGLVEQLLEDVEIAKLASYGGWNTAGNTLGTVLGNACVPCMNPDARRIALAHHLLEDWGYQSGARDVLRAWLMREYGGTDAMPDHLDAATAITTAALEPYAARIRAAGLTCAPRDIRHPWRRSFEVDFDL